MALTANDIDLIEDFWIQKSRVNFLAYRQFMRNDRFTSGWFMEDLCKHLQQFYLDLRAGLRPILLIQSPPQHGKEIADNCPTLTTNGWKPHGDLNIGDHVFSPDGKSVEITNTINQPDPCDMVVTLSNGEKIECHRNHEWTVTSHGWKNYKTLETQKMLDSGLWFGAKGVRGSRVKYQLPVVECLEFDKQKLDLHPYFLGMWLGDGSKTEPAIYTAFEENESIEYLSTLIPISNIIPHKKTKVRKVYFGNDTKTKGLLRKLCLYDNKHIPDKYIFSSKKQRLALLAGLIDSDGSLYKKSGQYRFINTNKKLIDGFKILLSTLGYSYSETKIEPRKEPNSYGIQDKSLCYQVGFTPFDVIPTMLPRKQSNIKPLRRRVSITDIEWISKEYQKPGKCITVENKDGLYLVGKKLTPTHNSWTVSDFISWISGKWPEIRSIYATYSDTLGVRCNLSQQRQIDSEKYNKIFPDTNLSSKKGEAIRNTNHLEFLDSDGNTTAGQFRNTTTGGSVTGESLDLGVIDDAVKGREQANSITWSQKIWEWFTDDFMTRFSENAGLLIIMTRWSTHDIIARLLKIEDQLKGKFKILNYQAIATKDEINRNEGDPLFPKLKSLEFLESKKAIMPQTSWESLYQGKPTVTGGNLFKDDWWEWYTKLPPIKYKFITALFA